MKLEKTESLKLHYVKNFQTTTSQLKNFNDSETYLAEKTLSDYISTR